MDAAVQTLIVLAVMAVFFVTELSHLLLPPWVVPLL